MIDLNKGIEEEVEEKLKCLSVIEKVSIKQDRTLKKLKDKLDDVKKLAEIIKNYRTCCKVSNDKVKPNETKKSSIIKKTSDKNQAIKKNTKTQLQTKNTVKSNKVVTIKDHFASNNKSKETSLKNAEKLKSIPNNGGKLKRTYSNVGSFKGITPNNFISKAIKRRSTKFSTPKILDMPIKEEETNNELPCFTDKLIEEKPTAISETIDPSKLFKCEYDAIDPSHNQSADFNYSLDDLKVTGGLDNYDKMFFKELVEESSDSDTSEIIKNEMKPVNQVESKIFKTFLDYRDDKNKYFYNKHFGKILVKELVKSLEAKIVKIDQMKYAYVKKFGVLDFNNSQEFEYSFFSNFYLTTLEDEYMKVKDSFQINPILTDLLALYKTLSKSDGDLIDIIRDLKAYKKQNVSIQTKLKVEILAQNDINLFDPNTSFKYNNITGYLCHIIRDIIFYYGIVSNINFVLPEHYNTENYYKFLMEKRRFYSQRAKKLNRIIN